MNTEEADLFFSFACAPVAPTSTPFVFLSSFDSQSVPEDLGAEERNSSHDHSVPSHLYAARLGAVPPLFHCLFPSPLNRAARRILNMTPSFSFDTSGWSDFSSQLPFSVFLPCSCIFPTSASLFSGPPGTNAITRPLRRLELSIKIFALLSAPVFCFFHFELCHPRRSFQHDCRLLLVNLPLSRMRNRRLQPSPYFQSVAEEVLAIFFSSRIKSREFSHENPSRLLRFFVDRSPRLTFPSRATNKGFLFALRPNLLLRMRGVFVLLQGADTPLSSTLS